VFECKVAWIIHNTYLTQITIQKDMINSQSKVQATKGVNQRKDNGLKEKTNR
jgi:hypothetical protein